MSLIAVVNRLVYWLLGFHNWWYGDRYYTIRKR